MMAEVRRRALVAARMSPAVPMAKVTSIIVSDPARPTTLKTRFVSGGQQLLRVDRGGGRLRVRPAAGRERAREDQQGETRRDHRHACREAAATIRR